MSDDVAMMLLSLAFSKKPLIKESKMKLWVVAMLMAMLLVPLSVCGLGLEDQLLTEAESIGLPSDTIQDIAMFKDFSFDTDVLNIRALDSRIDTMSATANQSNSAANIMDINSPSGVISIDWSKTQFWHPGYVCENMSEYTRIRGNYIDNATGENTFDYSVMLV